MTPAAVYCLRCGSAVQEVRPEHYWCSKCESSRRVVDTGIKCGLHAGCGGVVVVTYIGCDVDSHTCLACRKWVPAWDVVGA